MKMKTVTKKQILVSLLTLSMILAMFPGFLLADESVEISDDDSLTITIFNIGDFHGHQTSEQSDSDPGSPRFVTFVDELTAYYLETTGYQPILLLSGDNYFGQHVSNLFLGEPALQVLNRVGVRYATVGNHEFSFGNRRLTESFNITDPTERAAFLSEHEVENPLFDIINDDNILNTVSPGIPFLAADLRYDDGSRPSWVQPYTILDDWYDDYGIRVAIIGLTYVGMYATIDPHNREGLNFVMPGTAGMEEDESYGWLEDMISELRDDYGVQAVIALTHTSHGLQSNTIVDTLLVRGNAHFDAWLSAHTHAYTAETRVYPYGATDDSILRSTEIVSGGHHGRGFGQIQLHFEGNVLSGVTSHMYGGINGNDVRAVDPDPEVLQWVFGQGATWIRTDGEGSAAEDGLNLAIDASPADDNRSLWGWYQARIEWGDELGPRFVYGRNQHTRNQYLVYLMHDYILRAHPEDLEEAGAAGLIVMNNQSSWRGQGPHRLQWNPEDYVRTTDFLDALTFENTLPIFEMRGRDVIELLNMQAGPNPPGGAGGAERDPETGLPNWGTMQGQTVAGAFLHDGVWYLSATLEPISETGIYLFGASNHMFGGHVGTRTAANPDDLIETAGGQNMPLPGNTFGNALGFEVINFSGGQLEYNGNRYYSGPRFAMRDPESGMQLTIQAAWREQAIYRAGQTDIAAWIMVEATEGGTAEMEVWGFEARPDTPGNHSYWGTPAMLADTTGAHGSWNGEQMARDLVLHGAVVRVTATPNYGEVFSGWFSGDELVSTEEIFIFRSTEDVTLVAKFER